MLDMPKSSTYVGRHSEMIASCAFMEHGVRVWEPTVPDTHDMMVELNGKKLLAQVKTITRRERDGTAYYVIKGRRNSGAPYTLEDCDIFIGVYQGEVFMTENRQLSEYWSPVDRVDEYWTRIGKPREVSQAPFDKTKGERGNIADSKEATKRQGEGSGG